MDTSILEFLINKLKLEIEEAWKFGAFTYCDFDTFGNSSFHNLYKDEDVPLSTLYKIALKNECDDYKIALLHNASYEMSLRKEHIETLLKVVDSIYAKNIVN